jgi:hypothetical protein
MVEAIPIAAAQAQILAARLFAQATAQGQAILAAAATSDSTNNNDQPQTGGDQGQRGAGLPTPQGGQQAVPTSPQTGAAPPSLGPSPALAAGPNALPGAANPPPQTPQAANAAPILSRAALVEDFAPPGTIPTPPATPSAAPATALSTPPSLPPQPTVAPAPAVSFARIEAVVRQDTAAPLLADLEAVVAQKLAPPPVRTAARALLAAALPLEPDVTAADIKRATRNSGIFLEARLAQTPNPQTAGDGKAALLTLLRALRIWSVPAAPEESQAATEDDALAEAASDSAPSSAVNGAKAASSAPPPIKGQPPRPQAPTGSSLSADLASTAVRAQLIRRTEAAVARTTLLQMASSDTGAARPMTAPASASWLFELPVTTLQGPTTLPFEIDRDADQDGGSGGGAAGASAHTAWRVRFAFDIEPVGPVWVQAQLRGSAAAVTVLAERPGVAEALSRRAGDLADSLAAEGLKAHVSVSNGAAAVPPAAPGRFLDRAT